MRLHIQGRNLRVSERLKTYVEKKIVKLEHYLPALDEARVELKHEKTRSAEQSQIVEVTIWSDGHILRGEERASEFESAVDAVMEKLVKQIDRWKGKHYRSRAHLKEAISEPAPPARTILKRKRHSVQSMSEDDAIEKMDLLGHNFYLFVNQKTGEMNVVYRRDDGNYGLIEPAIQNG